MTSRVTKVVTASSWSDTAGNNRHASDPIKLEDAYQEVVAAMQRGQTASLEELQGAVEYLLDVVVTRRRSKRSP